tara:strand:- start:42996 stop:43142 length:147 start_codon:yes stop_codon:yes gene_type:complete
MNSLAKDAKYLLYSARDCSKLPCSAESPAQGEAEVGRLKEKVNQIMLS